MANHHVDNLELVKKNIKSFPNFPKAGVNFKDIFSVLRNPKALKAFIELVKEKARSVAGEIDLIVGLDARGFLFGPIMAAELEIPFVPIRKTGKLPGECYRTDYALEYGTASVEIQKESIGSGQRVLVVDDLLATGGTLAAAVDLIQKCGAQVTECFVLMEVNFLKGRKKLSKEIRVTSLIGYDEE